jgi:hypothetical protein
LLFPQFIVIQVLKLHLTNLQPFFSTLGYQLIVGVDFNSKHLSWGNRSVKTRSRVLKSTLESMNFSVISPSSPAYWPCMSRPCEQLVPIILDFQYWFLIPWKNMKWHPCFFIFIVIKKMSKKFFWNLCIKYKFLPKFNAFINMSYIYWYSYIYIYLCVLCGPRAGYNLFVGRSLETPGL